VSELIDGISRSSADQSKALSEVNEAVGQMDEMTQQNAALVEENTAALQSLLQQAQQLEKLSSYFKVSNDEGALIGGATLSSGNKISHHGSSSVKPDANKQQASRAKKGVKSPKPSPNKSANDIKTFNKNNNDSSDFEGGWEEF
jgi:hypothetical protein